QAPGNSRSSLFVSKIRFPHSLTMGWGFILVQVDHLTKKYGDVAAITDVTFSAEKGEILGFLGPNAAGKTTTMRIVTGFMPPTSGTASIAGFDILEESLEARERLGYLPEDVPPCEDR